MGRQVPGPGFRVSGVVWRESRFRISGFGILVPGIKFPGFGYRGLAPRRPGTEYEKSKPRLPPLRAGRHPLLARVWRFIKKQPNLYRGNRNPLIPSRSKHCRVRANPHLSFDSTGSGIQVSGVRFRVPGGRFPVSVRSSNVRGPGFGVKDVPPRQPGVG